MDYRWSVLRASQLCPFWYLLLGPSYARDYPIQRLNRDGSAHSGFSPLFCTHFLTVTAEYFIDKSRVAVLRNARIMESCSKGLNPSGKIRDIQLLEGLQPQTSQISKTSSGITDVVILLQDAL